MGNASSDRSEDQAYDVIKWIPGLNIAYGATRAVVYAAKGDSKRATLSVTSAAGTGMATVLGAGFGGPAGAVVAGAVGGGVAEAATIPIKNMPDKDY